MESKQPNNHLEGGVPYMNIDSAKERFCNPASFAVPIEIVGADSSHEVVFIDPECLFIDGLGGRIKAIRGRLGFSRETLAEAAGVSTNMIEDLETRPWDVPLGKLGDIFTAMRIEPQHIFGKGTVAVSTTNGQLIR